MHVYEEGKITQEIDEVMLKRKSDFHMFQGYEANE